jgi:hypothetical protein
MPYNQLIVFNTLAYASQDKQVCAPCMCARARRWPAVCVFLGGGLHAGGVCLRMVKRCCAIW